MVYTYILLSLLSVNPWQWPKYGQNLQNTHFQTGYGRMDSAIIKWSYPTDDSFPALYGPTLKDIDGDDYLEVFFGDGVTGPGKFYALNYDGTLRWSYVVGSPVWNAPAVGDINNDGQDEIIFGDCEGKINVLNETGSLIWSYSTGTNPVHSSPTFADIDNDNFCEIVCGTWNQKLFALNHDGSLFWSYTVPANWVHSGPALADIDNDGLYEIIFCSTMGSSYLYVLNHDGSFLWSYQSASTYSSPAVADIDGDNLYEIAFCHTGMLYVLNHDGSLLWSHQIGTVKEASPAIADIDGDSLYLEVVCGDENGVLYVFTHTGGLLWSFNTGGRIDRAPAIADLDGDGHLEIVTPNSISGFLYCLNHDGSVCWKIDLSYAVCEPTIGDIDNDGCLEVAVGEPYKKRVYVLDDPYGSINCGPTGVREKEVKLSSNLELNFSGRIIAFSLPDNGYTSLKLYDILGRQVETLFDQYMGKGSYDVKPCECIPTGIYFAVLTHRENRISHKLVLLK